MPGILFTYLLASQGSSRNGKTKSLEISPSSLSPTLPVAGGEARNEQG